VDIATVRSFFMWCTVLNGALLILFFLVCALAGDWVYRRHGRWFPMSREAFNIAIYSFLGVYKVLVLVFNLIPFVALAIVG
jgi:hypothetical protein